jgi:hypothetical protein
MGLHEIARLCGTGKAMSLIFGALLHIQEEFILNCAQQMNARKSYNVPPPKRTM